MEEVYHGQAPRAADDISSADTLAVLCKLDNQKLYKNSPVDLIRTVLGKALSKKHAPIQVGSIECQTEESLARFRRSRRAFGSHIEDKDAGPLDCATLVVFGNSCTGAPDLSARPRDRALRAHALPERGHVLEQMAVASLANLWASTGFR